MQVERLIIIIFPFFFIAIWVFALWIIALTGGWSRLAKHYSIKDTLNPYQGKKLRRKFGRLGGTSYKRVLIVGANMQGLYLSVDILFRVFHPPLFIPWSDIQTEERKGIFSSFTSLSFSRVPDVTVTISSKLMAQVQELKTGNLF